MGIGEFALNLVIELLGGAIQSSVGLVSLEFFTRRRVERRVEEATAEVIAPLLPFLSQEGISEERQRLLLQTCVDELRPLTTHPEDLFRGSLNGQKVFEQLYADRALPAVILEEGLKDIYALVCPRIATLLCRIPAAVKDWEAEAWSENFRRLDDIAHQLRSLFGQVDELTTQGAREADETLTRVRRAMAQKVGLELDLTGLRADQPLAGKFDDFFVHPIIMRPNEKLRGEDTLEALMLSSKEIDSVRCEDESFEWFLRQQTRAIVVGPPGAGKSTWSKWLQRQALSGRWPGIPVRIELRELSSEKLPSLHELIRDAAGRHFAEDLTGDRIGLWLAERNVAFILDGFDEIRSSERTQAYDWVVDLANAARACPFILTSRPLTTSHLERLKPQWRMWTIEPFDDSRIIDYITRWYRFAPLIQDSEREVDATNLAHAWQDDPTIGPLTANPLLLSTLLMVHHLDGSLPNGRSQLYRRYVDGMLGLWDDRRKVTAAAVELTTAQRRQIVRGLALSMFLSEQDLLEEQLALQTIDTLLRHNNLTLDATAVLNSLAERSGLIVGPGIYSFAHKSIAEYLVAEAIFEGDQRDSGGQRMDRFRLFEHRDNDRWNTVMFLWSGLAPTNDLESFIDECIESSNLPLACGLLMDQYAKFPGDIRRRLTLKALEKARKEPEGHYLILHYSHPVFRKGVSVHIPTFGLRQLGNGSTFSSFIFKAARDGVLSWSDVNAVKGFARSLLQLALIIAPTNSASEWRKHLRMPIPNFKRHSPSDTRTDETGKRLCLIEEGLISWAKHHSDNANSLAEIVRVYEEVWPDCQGRMPILLMSAALRLLRFAGPIERKAAAILMIILPSLDRRRIDSDWLADTHRWAVNWSYDEDAEDLLWAFRSRVNEIYQEGLVDTAIHSAAIQFVDSLTEERNLILR